MSTSITAKHQQEKFKQHKMEPSYFKSAAEMLQVALNYGIASIVLIILTLEQEVDNSLNLPFLRKVYFYIHSSLFIQLSILFLILTVIFIFLHFRIQKLYNDKLNRLISAQAERDIVINNSDRKNSNGNYGM
jgi:uncharacterized ion transporter superfamily protein YfcC